MSVDKYKLSKYMLISLLIHLSTLLCFIGALLPPKSYEIHANHIMHVKFYSSASIENILIPPHIQQAAPQPHLAHEAQGHTHELHIKNQKKIHHKKNSIHQQSHHAISGKKLNQFISYLYNKINAHKIYPSSARSMDQAGVVVVSFELEVDGSIRHARITKSSGYPILDQAALACLNNSTPFNKAHRFIDHAQSFNLPIKYDLNYQE